jgi:hypothetical protein
MERSISTYEAPALLDVHNSLSRLDLYERLTGKPQGAVEAGLNAKLAPGTVEFAAEDNGWSNPVRRDYVKGAEDGMPIRCHARGWMVEDTKGGKFIVQFAHLAAFMHSQAWGKAGVPPEAFIVQANWAMWLSEAQRLAFVVLADRKVNIYWVDRDEAIVEALRKGVVDMAGRIEAKDPPPVDAAPVKVEAVATADDKAEIDVDAVCGRWRAGQVRRATARNELQLAEHAYDASTAVLKQAIKPGGHHDHEGFRIHHNAKTKAITEEKIDGSYF